MTRLPHLGRLRVATGPGEERDDGTPAERDGDGTDPAPGAAPATDARPEPAAGDGAGPAPEADTATATRPESVADELPASDPHTEPGRAAPPEERPRPRGDGRRPRVPVRRLAPALAAALLVLAGCGFFYGAHQLRSTPSAENHALTDADATTRVAGDVGNALARVFSYTPDGLAATERAARSVLAGRAERQYAELMGRIRADLAKQRVTLSTQAVRTGVIELDGDSARLLVFLDQISHRGKAGTTSAAAQLTVTARRQGDQWRIVDIRTR
jgi:Mce-associated membrane protein